MSLLPGYRDSSALAKGSLWLLYVRMMFALVLIWSGLEQRELLLAAQTGEFESREALISAIDAGGKRELLLARIDLVLVIAFMIVFLAWIWHSCFNAAIKDEAGVPSPAWAVGCYFIPFANLWLPLSTMRRIWSSTAAQAGKPAERGGALLGTWWTLYLVRILLALAWGGIVMRATTIDDYLHAREVRFWACVTTLLVCALFVVMVRRLTELQRLAFRPADLQSVSAPALPG